MDARQFNYAMKGSGGELNKLLTHEGLSCTQAENSPSAYIIEKKLLKKINTAITDKDFDVPRNLLRFVDIHWFEDKLNRISNVDKLAKLMDTMNSKGLRFLIKELR